MFCIYPVYQSKYAIVALQIILRDFICVVLVRQHKKMTKRLVLNIENQTLSRFKMRFKKPYANVFLTNHR